MAWHQEHKQQTREKILASAAYLFTKDGFDNVGINDVMSNAGLTRGAFYAHFSSKAELYAEAIMNAAMEAGKLSDPSSPNAPSLDKLIKAYLSMEHRNGEKFRCPLAFLTTDISQRDTQVRDAYTRVFNGFIRRLNTITERKIGQTDNEKSLQHAVMLIGGLAIARAVNDDGVAQEILSACEKGLTADLTKLSDENHQNNAS
jgi:TetR/AcrR family transcriptional repressor of nem operon